MHPQIPIIAIIFVINIQLINSADYAQTSDETQPAYTLDDIYNEQNDSSVDRYFERCYGAYGCFPVEFPWESNQRAHSVYPYSPKVLNVKFPAFRNDNKTIPKFIDINDPSTITSLNINKLHKIYVISHGFLELGNSQWLINMKNELLSYDNQATVILVDWRRGSAPPYYQAVANIRVVGAVVAHMIMGIAIELEMDNLDNLHLIGHSLGSHLSGYAGYHLQRDFSMKAGRITGLDPAKPYFEFTPEIVRLDPSDAKFVDILHTDGSTFQERSFGLMQKIGNLDFYPNGGRNQPVCDGNILDATCSHKNAVELYTESINTDCSFMAVSCESYEHFLHGLCTDCNKQSCMKFGFHSQNSYEHSYHKGKIQNSYYFLTSPTLPFCKFHYKISLKISNLTINDGEIGTINARLIGIDGRKSEKILVTKSQLAFNAGKTYSFLVTSSDIGADLETLRILYNYNLSLLRLNIPKISIDYIEVQSIEYLRTYRVCTKNGKPLIAGFIVELKEKYCEN